MQNKAKNKKLLIVVRVNSIYCCIKCAVFYDDEAKLQSGRDNEVITCDAVSGGDDNESDNDEGNVNESRGGTLCY